MDEEKITVEEKKTEKVIGPVHRRLAALCTVKSLVTLALTGVFTVLAVRGEIAQDFMTIYAVIIAFYFGTQSQKTADSGDGNG